MIDLGVDLLQHFGGENDVFVAALEIVFSLEIRVLVEDHLIHIEFVQIGIQQ